MSKMSIEVANRTKTADFMISSVEVHQDDVVAGLVDTFEGLDAETILKLLLAIVALFRKVTDVMGDAELEYVAEQADDPPVRKERDRRFAELIVALRQLRDLVNSILGEAGVKLYGLGGELPRTPKGLSDRGKHVIKQLHQHPTTVTGLFDATFDSAKAAATLEPMQTGLAAAFKAVGREVREGHAALTTRDRAVAEWVGAYPAVGAVLTGLYRLAGQPELADRIRPTVRRTTGLDPEPEAEAPVVEETEESE